MTQTFHFTLGPVQGFVAQARRTRDFWAGSFILSWLAAVAMQTVRAQNGSIKFPIPDEQLMTALTEGGQGPRQGGVPNRFKAEVGDDFDPDRVTAAVQQAWKALAEAVWDHDLQHLPADGETRRIWDRQIGGFWEMQWALTDDADDATPIDRLKNWRSHRPPEEPGAKCMMMDGWQELSGAPAPGRKVTEFWAALRERGRSGYKTDLRPGEALCAIAYVKRRFTRVFASLRVDLADGQTLHGWELPSGVPSVLYLAAAPWLAQLITKVREKGLEDDLEDFHRAARDLTGGYGEWDSNIRMVREAAGDRVKWAALDGSVFFDSVLENRKLWDEPTQATRLSKKLAALRRQVEIEPVSPFYAILLMDGDELGKQMSNSERQGAITAGLNRFAGGVEALVEEHSGFLVYAGGDDVLALLPLECALDCATAIRRHYLNCFNGTEITTSISAAIQYVHIKTPLGKVLKDAHQLLDDIAKDHHGRDSLAIRIWKPGGLAAEWGMPWDKALEQGRPQLARLAELFRNQEAEAGGMSSKFFYGLRERLGVLNPATGPSQRSDDAAQVLRFDQQIDLMTMQFLNSGVNRTAWKRAEAREQIRPLLEQCGDWFRRPENHAIEQRSGRLSIDGALIVRFLAHKGVETR